MAGRNGADAMLIADDVETAPGRRLRGGARAMRVAGIFVALSVLGACSSVPEAMDPTTWTGPSTEEAARAGEDGEAQNQLQAERGEAPPGADQDYPNLASVDRQAAARDDMQQGLVADPKAPRYADAVQRQGESAMPKEPPQPTPEPQAGATAPAPESQPVMPVTPVPQESAEAPARTEPMTPAPTAGSQDESMPVAEPKSEPAGTGGVMTAETAPTSRSATMGDSTGGIDQSEMADRMKRRLAEIRSRSSAQGSLMTSDLQQDAGGGLSTVVVSSAGVQPESDDVVARSSFDYDLRSSGADGRYVDNRGALPVPRNAVRVATIRFQHGTANLTGRDRRILQDVAQLQRERGGRLRIIGHASQRTQNMEYDRHKLVNFEISVARADRVAEQLVRMGVPRNEVLVAAVGDSQPVYEEIMPSGEAGNRRTEIYLSN